MPLHELRIDSNNGGDIVIGGVTEYVCGYNRFYIHRESGETLSYPRDTFSNVFHRIQGSSRWRYIHLKRVPERLRAAKETHSRGWQGSRTSSTNADRK